MAEIDWRKNRGLPMRYFPAIAAALLALPALAAEPWEGVWEGAIGQSRIIVELEPEGARYSYIGRPNDLGLIVQARGGAVTLTETLAPNIAADDIKGNARLVSGYWHLKLEGEKLNGNWTNASGGARHPVFLTRVSVQPDAADANQKPGAFGAYSARWLATSPRFVPMGEEASVGVLSYTLVKDDLYGNLLPRLTRAPPGVRVEAVNNLLQNLQRKLVLADRNCIQDLRGEAALNDLARLKTIDAARTARDKPVSQDEVKLVYGSASLLTLVETRTSFCGGAHPNTSVAAYTFDLVNPRQISALGTDEKSFDDLRPSGIGAALDLAAPARRQKFDDLWVAQMRAAMAALKAHPRGKDNAEIDTACAAEFERILAEGAGKADKIAYAMPEGLAVRLTGFPQVIAVCLTHYPPNPVVVPWREVVPFYKAGQRLLPG